MNPTVADGRMADDRVLPAESSGAVSTWGSLRIPVFRLLWGAALVSNIGSWMQTVGAQWQLVHEPNASALVALVQTATSLPVLVLALPAGVLADLIDRRRLLIAAQAFQFVVAASLAVLTVAGFLPPVLLLLLTFALGAGAAVQLPAWQATIPDLVPRVELPGASVLGSISVNLARGIGPAVAGFVIAQFGVAAVFGANAVSFAVFGLALIAWRRTADGPTARPETFGLALRAGVRYVRYAPVVRRMVLRLLLFVIPASVLWALLPLVATGQLHLGPDGYGLLLGAVGVGSIAGAFLLPRVRAHLRAGPALAAASSVYTVALIVLVSTHSVAVAIVVLVAAGVAWIEVLASANAAVQMFVPVWVRARALAIYQVALFGSTAFASFGWGLAANRWGITPTFLIAASILAAGAATLVWWPFHDIAGLDRSPALYWPQPHLVLDPADFQGPVRVTVTYSVPSQRQADFLAAMPAVRHSRLRTGGTGWSLSRDGQAPNRFVEEFLVPSWDEHRRQHDGRLTGADRAALDKARSLADRPPEVDHLFAEAISRH